MLMRWVASIFFQGGKSNCSICIWNGSIALSRVSPELAVQETYGWNPFSDSAAKWWKSPGMNMGYLGDMSFSVFKVFLMLSMAVEALALGLMLIRMKKQLWELSGKVERAEGQPEAWCQCCTLFGESFALNRHDSYLIHIIMGASCKV